MPFCSDFALLDATEECAATETVLHDRSSRPIGYFCPVLTADGKVDCAPK